MGSSSSKIGHPNHILRKKLRDLPYYKLNERDYNFLSYQSGLNKDEIKQIFEKHLETHPDGKMNRKDFCELYIELRKDTPELIEGLTENIFLALDINNPETDLINLNEFLITYALTSRGDLRKKLEYAFELYDTNHDNALDLDEVKEIIYGILELFRPPREGPNIDEMTKECFKHLKISQVVKKDDFINGLLQNRSINAMLSPSIAK